jgi:hypothetical protein
MAGKYDLIIEQGATYILPITWKDGSGALVNLTGYTAKMQIKDMSGNVLFALTDTAGITLGGAAGTVTIKLTAVQTTTLTTTATAKYDLYLTAPNGDVTRLLKGWVTPDPEVTT